MPYYGRAENIGNLDARVLQQFIMDNFTPGKCLIVANGIKNHGEYVQLVRERLGDYPAVPEHEYDNRQKANYIGGEMRTWTETPDTNISLVFESAPWTDPDMAAFQVMNTLIGSAQGFSQGGPGKGMYCRAVTNLMQQHAFVNSASAINSHFTDTGLFGMNIEGPGSHSAELLSVMLEELNALREPIPDAELNRAKNILKMNIIMALERSDNRLEEMARQYMTFGDLTINAYCDIVDQVSSAQINKAASKALSGVPTMVVAGGAINLVPSTTEVARQLN